MKGISGIIGGVVVIILLLVTLSLTLAVLNYAYGVQQIEMKTYMSQLSQPHVMQVSPDSVMASGRLMASYIIYPSGRVVLLNETVSGIRDFRSFLNNNPWAIIVFSNGQWINVTSQTAIPPGIGYLGSGQGIPYYPNTIEPWNLTQLNKFMLDGFKYNTPIYSEINVNETYMGKTYSLVLNPTNPIVYGMGRILSVPVESTRGWLNFTMVYAEPIGLNDHSSIGFALIVPNASNIMEIIYFRILINTSYNLLQNGYIEYNISYGNYQYWENPVYEPSYYQCGFMNSFYTYNESTIFFENVSQILGPNTSWWAIWNFESYPVFKVAIKFSPGKPAKVYLWMLNGTEWDKVYMPAINGTVVPVNTVTLFWTNWIVGYWYNVSFVDWSSVTQAQAWPISLYTEAVNGTPWPNPSYSYGANTTVFLLPLVPQVGSDVLVVPSTYYVPPSSYIYYDGSYLTNPSPPYIPDTLLLNVTYSI